MPLFKLQTEFWVPVSIDQVWTFMSEAQNLARLTPPHYGCRVEAEGALHEGQRVIITLAPYGVKLPLPWQSLLTNVVAEGPAREFTDIQESGPFKTWRHRHVFETGASSIEGQRSNAKINISQPGTWIRDHVEYELHGEAAGRIAHTLFARQNIEGLFAYRRAQTAAALADASNKAHDQNQQHR